MSEIAGTGERAVTAPDRRVFVRLQRQEQWRNITLVLPAIILMLVFYVYPMASLFVRSVTAPETGGFTVEHYRHLMETPAYSKVLVNTLRISFTVTLVTFVLGYPLAYLLNSLPANKRNLLLIGVLIPFWTSILVRTYAWMVLFQRQGVLNTVLIQAGLTDEPLELTFNAFGVHIGMVHVLLPYMILPLLSVMQGIDKNLMKAAENLGANPLRAFVRIFFPLSLPGVGAGLSLVFILAIGFFITPALMGGMRETMVAQLIEKLIRLLLNWELGSALAFVLLAMTLVLFTVFNRLLGLDRLLGGGER
jgi:putative spermidine/putrescine transport system permease protein